MAENCSVVRVSVFSFSRLVQVERILYESGKNMAKNEGLHHWDNSHFKNALILCLCILRHKVYLVLDEKIPAATFQTKVTADKMKFSKFAVKPNCSKHGIGSFCIHAIEQLAVNESCKFICCEVYDQSSKTLAFYEHRGFMTVGKKTTMKYIELILEKVLL